MPREIERKFLIAGDYKSEAYASERIIQAYLCSVPERVVRIRIKGEKGFITIKGTTNDGGLSRFEWEKEIPLEDAQSLLRLAEHGVIDKTRYFIRNTDGHHIWEVDEFHGENDGLTMAEIELSDEDDFFDKPAWLGKEVSGDKRYYNAYLSNNPYKSWRK